MRDDAESAHLRARVDDDEDDEVYPASPCKRNPSDPASRYDEGKPPKNITRYAATLKNVVPVRTVERSATGCAKIDQAGLFSFVTYSWVFEYLLQAYRGNLTETSWTCSIFDGANTNLTRLEMMWEEELKARPAEPKLWKVVYAFIATRLWTACAVFAFCLVFGFIGPTCFIRGLISYAEQPLKDGEVSYGYGFALATAVLLVEFARVLAYGATWAISYRTGIRVRSAVLGLLFKKLINSKTHLGGKSAEIINMFANDGQRLFDAITFLPLVLIGPFVLFGGCIYLCVVIGWWSLVGVLVFVIFDVIQYGLGMTMLRCRERAIKKTDNRVALMGEIVKHIRLIKMNAWEKSFIDKIGRNDLLASDAFSAMTVFFVMMFGIRMIPYGGRYMGEALVALRRISQVLQVEHWEKPIQATSNPDVAVSYQNATFKWTEAVNTTVPQRRRRGKKQEEAEPIVETVKETEVFHLQNIDLKIKKRELIGICGVVGSGKSALLNSILGHMEQETGEAQVGGDIAYVPQTPWIQNATFQENVFFGLEENKIRYHRVVDACQLKRDLAQMPEKEKTEIGERGATLSGGQKARISLARALYSNRDVYLLDDVLASVDRKVADRIFKDAICDYLKYKGKTVLMVTFDVNRLSECDRVIYMENGRIVGDDPHHILVKACDSYRGFCEAATLYRKKEDGTLVIHEQPSKAQVDSIKKELEKAKVIEEEEDLGLAKMSIGLYKKYAVAAGSWFIWAFLMLIFVVNVFSTLFATYWLSTWLKSGHGEQLVDVNGTEVLRGHQSMADSSDTQYYSTIYALSLVVLFFSGLIKATLFVKISLNAATQLHNNMFNSLMHACTQFFDSNPTGRILNRFAKDMDEIDVKLPFTIEVFLQNMITCIGYLLVIAWVFPYFLLAAVPLFGVFLIFVLCFKAGIRSLKRSENISRSPLYDHISASLEGIPVIHSYGQTNRFIETLKQRLDANSGAIFMFQTAMRWLAVWLDLLVVAVTFAVAVCIVLLTGKVSPADAGMAIAFAIQMSGIFQFAIRNQTDMEAKMTSVERVVHYADNITSEGLWDTPKGVDVPGGWPRNGQIDFADVKLKYPSNTEMSLNGLTFTIKPKEKIGIIGRTGSGKSSIANVLYRLYKTTWGKIYIDGVDIETIGLHTLRRSMAVIPQDPVLFAGSIRSNLDKSGVFTDDQIWIALEKTYMKAKIQRLENGLEAKVASDGENFSVDASLDKLIHQCLWECLADCTVLLIAHKLENVARCDRVLLMDGGRLIAFDEPSVLIEKTPELKKVVEEDAALPESAIRQALDASTILVLENDGSTSLTSVDPSITPRLGTHQNHGELEDDSNKSVKSLEVVKTPSRESPVIIEKENSSQSDQDLEVLEDDDDKRLWTMKDEAQPVHQTTMS
ncbi:unnamed protein product, partial [Mesorhabditis spiculigera]